MQSATFIVGGLRSSLTGEAYAGEAAYYQSLVDILEPQREKLGQPPEAPCVASTGCEAPGAARQEVR